MNNDWDALLGAVVRGLRDQVAPQVEDEQARIQLHAAIYVLENLRLQGGWSTQLLMRHVQAQQSFFATLRTALPDAGPPLPAAQHAPRDIARLRSEGDAAINSVIDLLHGMPPAQRGEGHAQAAAALSAYLRETVAIDRGATAKSMMLELSGPGSQTLD